MKNFRIGMRKLVLAGLVVFGFSGSLFGAEMFASVESKAYKNYYNILDYHKLKNEYNLDNPNEAEIKDFTAELFTARHIYKIDKVRDLNEEFQFGRNNIAKLLEYKNDYYSGFNAGIYLINNKKIIVAFGGTGANESYDGESYLTDVITDLSLITLEIGQVKHIQPIMDDAFRLADDLNISKGNVSVSGHSLGGGLAQYASMLTGVKAVTLNTAPNPINLFTITKLMEQGEWIYGENQITNIMVENDILTSSIRHIEENLGSSPLPLSSYMKKNKLLKLIYGKRIFVKSGSPYNPLTAHKSGLFLETSYTNITDFSLFKNSFFVDVSANTPLYDSVFYLMKNHSITYPKKERGYKFYPNEKVTGYEFSIFIVNNYFYNEFRDSGFNNQLDYINNFLSSVNIKIEASQNVNSAQLDTIFKEIFIAVTNDSWQYNDGGKTHNRIIEYIFNNLDKLYPKVDVQGYNITRGELSLLLYSKSKVKMNKILDNLAPLYFQRTLSKVEEDGKGKISSDIKEAFLLLPGNLADAFSVMITELKK